MKVIKECDIIDYMNSIPLHEFFGENVVVDCGKFVYIALISKISMQTLSLYPVQQTDFERYEFDSRGIRIQRTDVCNTPPIVSYGQGHDSTWRGDNYYRDDSHTYQQEPQMRIWDSPTRWVSPYAEEQPVENTPEQERACGLLRRMYNRIRRIPNEATVDSDGCMTEEV